MRRVPLLLLVVVALDRGAVPAAADAGSLRHAGEAGPYRVFVFTASALQRPGPVDVSVIVQNARTGEDLPDAVVQVTATPAGDDKPNIQIRATHEAATIPLFQAAVFDLPTPGVWQIGIAISGPLGDARVVVPVEVESPLPRWLELWPWLAWPLVPIALFTLYQVRVWRRTRAAGFGAKRATP